QTTRSSPSPCRKDEPNFGRRRPNTKLSRHSSPQHRNGSTRPSHVINVSPMSCTDLFGTWRLSSSAACTRGRWTLRSEHGDIAAIVFADDLHDLVPAEACIPYECPGPSPRPCRLLRVFVNDFVEDVGSAGACHTLDGMKLFAGLLDPADRMFA